MPFEVRLGGMGHCMEKIGAKRRWRFAPRTEYQLIRLTIPRRILTNPISKNENETAQPKVSNKYTLMVSRSAGSMKIRN
jgi:hypothetical protein